MLISKNYRFGDMLKNTLKYVKFQSFVWNFSKIISFKITAGPYARILRLLLAENDQLLRGYGVTNWHRRWTSKGQQRKWLLFPKTQLSYTRSWAAVTYSQLGRKQPGFVFIILLYSELIQFSLYAKGIASPIRNINIPMEQSVQLT